MGGDDQTTTTNSSGLTRQNLLQHLNIVQTTLNQRSQSPTTITNNPATVNRILQQYQLRAALNSSGQLSSGQLNNEQIASPSPPPQPPSSSTT